GRAHGRAVGHRAAGRGLAGRQLGGHPRRHGPVHPPPPHPVGDVRRGRPDPHRKGVARLMADVTMPQLGETVTEGTITRWFKQVGDKVEEDEALFEVSTDKVDSEVPAAASGYLAEILVKEGETVDVGAGPSGPKRVLSPVVRRLIAEHDLDPDDIAGTGYQSRITRDDVLAHLDRGAAARPATAPAAAAAAAPAPRSTAAAPTGAPTAAGDHVVPFSNIRRRTAEHMVRSLDTSAHVLTVIEVDFDNVDRVRQAAKGQWKAEEGFSLTYLPFVSRAVIDAIRDFPHVNASVDGDSLVVHRAVHLGFAVDLSFEGPIVPVLPHAARN